MKIRKATNTYLYSIDDTKLKSYTIIKDEVIDFHQRLLGSSSANCYTVNYQITEARKNFLYKPDTQMK